MKSEALTDDVYKAKLVWFEKAVAFWRNVISGRESSSNLVSTRILKVHIICILSNLAYYPR